MAAVASCRFVDMAEETETGGAAGLEDAALTFDDAEVAEPAALGVVDAVTPDEAAPALAATPDE